MSKPKSRRIPKLIWFVTAAVLMVVLWVFLAVWLPYHKEQVAIREIERLGGWYIVEEGGPEWLQNLAGERWGQWLDSVEEVEILVGSQASDDELQHLIVKHLSGLNNLKRLELGASKISDEGLKHIPLLTNLESLELIGTDISDNGLRHIEGLLTLRVLDLSGTQITDKGLKHISGLTSLELLYLEYTQISNEGLKHLSGFTNLEWLDLGNTRITDEGLKHLSSLTNLKWLFLDETQVTEESVKELQKVLPKCEISY